LAGGIDTTGFRTRDGTTNKHLSLDLDATREALAKGEPLLPQKQRTRGWRD
jgi:hypothetical protein